MASETAWCLVHFGLVRFKMHRKFDSEMEQILLFKTPNNSEWEYERVIGI